MTDYRLWKGKDSDFTLEQLADTISSRLRWDEEVDRMAREGDWEWNRHKPFDPTRTEKLIDDEEDGS